MGKVGWQKYLDQRVAKSVSDLFLIVEEKNLGVWMPLERVFVTVLDVASGFEKNVLFYTGGLELGKYVGVI